MRKSCRAYVEKTDNRCQKRAMPGSHYCFWHQSWGVNVIGAIVTFVAGLLLAPPTQSLYEKYFPSANSKLLDEITANKPSLVLFVNDMKIPADGPILVPKSRELDITVSNVGKGTADQIMVDILFPKQCTNVVTSGQWQQQISPTIEKNGRLQRDEDWLHWSYISLTAIPGEGCKLVMPPIYLPKQSYYTFLRVVIAASAKQTKLQQSSVMLQLMK